MHNEKRTISEDTYELLTLFVLDDLANNRGDDIDGVLINGQKAYIATSRLYSLISAPGLPEKHFEMLLSHAGSIVEEAEILWRTRYDTTERLINILNSEAVLAEDEKTLYPGLLGNIAASKPGTGPALLRFALLSGLVGETERGVPPHTMIDLFANPHIAGNLLEQTFNHIVQNLDVYQYAQTFEASNRPVISSLSKNPHAPDWMSGLLQLGTVG